jgi:hypothetical protein
MSTHGHTGLSRWVYGSVANKVLHTSKCPLLLIRAGRDGKESALDEDEALSALDPRQ